ncbi:MAG: DUF4115 domain-containing protein [Cyanobacteria bacterium REEB459]|nr:DUF4115 domain-containing protein [Cyanobacteria bacterium REEB459]
MANLAPTQIEQLQKIGAYLSQLRQDRGLSLDVVANQTFIRPTILQAIEAGLHQDLPQPIFIQGFIRRYGDSLGLDGKALAQEFSLTPTDINPIHGFLPDNGEVKPVASNGTKPPAAQQELAQPQITPRVRSLPRPRVARGGRQGVRFLGLGLGLALLALGWWWWKGWDSSSPVQSVAPSQSVSPVSMVKPTPSPAKPVAPVVVQTSLSDRSWLAVTADGQSLYEGIVPKGYVKTWTAQQSMLIKAGNAGAVNLTINGDKTVVMGKPGAVKTLTLRPESTAAVIVP